jgi:hypothetical protein
MITTTIMGGLGNQMFQYAAGYALSRRLEVPMQLDLSFYEGQEKRKYELAELCIDCDAHSPGLKDSRSKKARFWGKPSFTEHSYVEPVLCYDAATEALQSPCRIDGYFQSERYFSRYREDVMRQYRPKGDLTERNKAYLERIRSSTCSVAVHLRRGDYLEQKIASVHGVLSDHYYENAIKLLSSIVGSERELFIFTDDVLFARNKWGQDKNAIIVEGNEDYPAQDIYLMSACDHNIIANSSFSWWGAWLNAGADKTVIAPRQWFQPEVLRKKNTCDLYPDGWVLM